MRNLKVVIIDDEESARNVLVNLIKRNTSSISILGLASNLEEGVELIKKTKPDLVFLDVQMPNYNGYEISNFFDSIEFEIIFVTAYDQYAIKAFELSAIDYLVKPVNRDRLTKAIEKATESIVANDKLQEYQILADSFKERELKKIIIPELGNRRVVNIKDIIAIEADGAYSKVYLGNREQIIIGKNLKYFENLLSDSAIFERVHRTWYINKDEIKSINKTKLSIVMSNDVEARVSRSKLENFEKSLVNS